MDVREYCPVCNEQHSDELDCQGAAFARHHIGVALQNVEREWLTAQLNPCLDSSDHDWATIPYTFEGKRSSVQQCRICDLGRNPDTGKYYPRADCDKKGHRWIVGEVVGANRDITYCDDCGSIREGK